MSQSILSRCRRGTWLALLLTAALVVLGDWLFFRQPIGWTLALFLLAVTAALLIRPGRSDARRATIIVSALLVGLAGALALEPGPLAVLLASLGVVVLASARRSGWRSSVAAWGSRLTRFVIQPLIQPVRDLALCRRWRASRPGRTGGGRFLAAWALPVVLSAIFIGLFWLANPVLDLWSHQIGNWIRQQAAEWSKWLNPLRILFWLALAAVAWTLMRHRARPRRTASILRVRVVPGERITRWGAAAMVVRCLILFNVVFAGQLLLDARYLVAGADLPQGMTYAQYAHRGAYPLMATALLAGAFVLITFRSRGAAERSATARRLVYLWIAQNLILLASAAWRLRMYVDVYSLTMWRIAAAIWMLLVAAGLVWIVVRIVWSRSNVWLLRVNLLTALVVLYACCFLNFAGWIAWFNVKHCRQVTGEGVPIDLVYLERLGPPALPAARWLARHTANRDTAASADDIAQRLEHRLDSQLDHWRSWTLQRQWIAAAVTAEAP